MPSTGPTASWTRSASMRDGGLVGQVADLEPDCRARHAASGVELVGIPPDGDDPRPGRSQGAGRRADR